MNFGLQFGGEWHDLIFFQTYTNSPIICSSASQKRPSLGWNGFLFINKSIVLRIKRFNWFFETAESFEETLFKKYLPLNSAMMINTNYCKTCNKSRLLIFSFFIFPRLFLQVDSHWRSTFINLNIIVNCSLDIYKMSYSLFIQN